MPSLSESAICRFRCWAWLSFQYLSPRLFFSYWTALGINVRIIPLTSQFLNRSMRHRQRSTRLNPQSADLRVGCGLRPDRLQNSRWQYSDVAAGKFIVRSHYLAQQPLLPCLPSRSGGQSGFYFWISSSVLNPPIDHRTPTNFVTTSRTLPKMIPSIV